MWCSLYSQRHYLEESCKIKKRSTEEHIILFISAGVSVGILPFLVIRTLQQDWLIAALDAAIVTIGASIFLVVFNTGRTLFARWTLALCCMATVTLTVLIKGEAQLLWAYPALASLFFLLTPNPAAILATSLLVLLGFVIWPSVNAFIAIEFYISAAATFLFSFAFANRMRAQQHQLEKLATHDELTGCRNRRSLEQKVNDIIQSQERNPQPCSLLLIDLDRFKQVNDSYGHKKGDELLIQFAKMVRDSIRKSDGFYRYGGEEFVVLTENTPVSQAMKLAEKLRSNAETILRAGDHPVTISIGIAEFLPKETGENWFGRADKALYLAKETGRNSCKAA